MQYFYTSHDIIQSSNYATLNITQRCFSSQKCMRVSLNNKGEYLQKRNVHDFECVSFLCLMFLGKNNNSKRIGNVLFPIHSQFQQQHMVLFCDIYLSTYIIPQINKKNKFIRNLNTHTHIKYVIRFKNYLFKKICRTFSVLKHCLQIL